MTDADSTTRPWGRRGLVVAIVTLLVIAIGIGAWVIVRDHHTSTDSAMASRAQQVMPFDLNRTSHVFTKTAEGGVQVVVVRDLSDTGDRDLIRSHLAAEAASFRRGNYSDPARIHGMDMPGVKELEQGATRVVVTYQDLPGGARITYASTEPPLIAALHGWFDRQASDHSMPGMGG